MSKLGEKLGYIKGLMECIDLSKDPSLGKLIAGIADLLAELTEHVENTEELLEDLNDYVESIDEDLCDLEDDCLDFNKDRFEDEDEEEPIDFAPRKDGKLRFIGKKDETGEDEEEETPFGGSEDNDEANEDDDDYEDCLVGAVCPECRSMFFVNVMYDDDTEYICPHCSKRVLPVPLSPETAPIAKPVDEDR